MRVHTHTRTVHMLQECLVVVMVTRALVQKYLLSINLDVIKTSHMLLEFLFINFILYETYFRKPHAGPRTTYCRASRRIKEEEGENGGPPCEGSRRDASI